MCTKLKRTQVKRLLIARLLNRKRYKIAQVRPFIAECQSGASAAGANESYIVFMNELAQKTQPDYALRHNHTSKFSVKICFSPYTENIFLNLLWLDS